MGGVGSRGACGVCAGWTAFVVVLLSMLALVGVVLSLDDFGETGSGDILENIY